jgi:hypothetical protein
MIRQHQQCLYLKKTLSHRKERDKIMKEMDLTLITELTPLAILDQVHTIEGKIIITIEVEVDGVARIITMDKVVTTKEAINVNITHTITKIEK